MRPSEWARTRSLRKPSRRIDVRLLLALLLAAGLLIYYAVRHQRTSVPLGPLDGRAVVVDGDSIEIAGARVRLEGIDAPELHQFCTDAGGQPWACGRTAAQELRSRIAGRELRCVPSRDDRYDRAVAVCSLPDGTDLNGWMVRQGWALAYGRGGSYRLEQQEAQAAGRGIWAGTFTPPWEWRQRHPD
jgi:endonuclease YncB( thermonuclease family)